MPVRLVGSGGDVTNPAMIDHYPYGVITPNNPVDWVEAGTGQGIVGPSGSTSTATMIFGVGVDYAQGASDTVVRVFPFDSSQLWEVDCANAATTRRLHPRGGVPPAMLCNVPKQGESIPSWNSGDLTFAASVPEPGSTQCRLWCH